jgi:hypothetical protein
MAARGRWRWDGTRVEAPAAHAAAPAAAAVVAGASGEQDPRACMLAVLRRAAAEGGGEEDLDPAAEAWFTDALSGSGAFRAFLGAMCGRPDLYEGGSAWHAGVGPRDREEVVIAAAARGACGEEERVRALEELGRQRAVLEDAAGCGDIEACHAALERLKRCGALGCCGGQGCPLGGGGGVLGVGEVLAPALAAASRGGQMAILAYLWECFPLANLAPVAREAADPAVTKWLVDHGWAGEGAARDYNILQWGFSHV